MLKDFMDGEVYKALGGHDKRDLLFAMAFDGFLCFKDDKKYSMWPIVLTPLNFDPTVR